jgi:hypothetical protein
MSTSEDTAIERPPWARKRKRNNSSISLSDGIIAPETTPTTSPKLTIQSPHIFRLSTPPLIRDETPPPSTAGAEKTGPGIASPVVEKALGRDGSLSRSNSPRTTVAKRLSNMNLNKGEIVSEFEDGSEDITTSGEWDSLSNSMSKKSLNEKLSNTKRPESQSVERPTLQHSSSSDIQPPRKRLPPPRGIKSPPPRSNHPIIRPEGSSPSSTPSSSQPTTDNWFDLSTLTWHDSEITGHLMLDPDDDGYGINGIGFRPTPAMALARSQRRKQQMTAWRTREEREERERRAEKRRQGRAMYPDSDLAAPVPVLNLSSIADSMDKKSVRFAV